MNRLVGVGWRVDYTLSSSLLRTVEEPLVHLRLEVAAAQVPTSRSALAALVFAYSIWGARDFLKHSLPSLSLIVPSL